MKGFKNEIRRRWYLRWLLVFSNWLFQGILHADRTEKIYRILCTLVFSLPFLYFFHVFTPWPAWQTVLVSLVIGHTVNWLFNGNLSALLIHRLFLRKTTKEELFRFLLYIRRRTKGKPALLYVAAFGSLSRGELKHSSDLDVSIVRKSGTANALSALREVFIIKKTADLKGIPLELFLSDTPEDSVRRFGGEKVPVAVSDPDGTLGKYYDRTMDLEEAYNLNQR